jgi:K+-sensing histidine kinase KdpD
MKEIALHLLDLAENSVSAHEKTVHIDVREDFRTNQLITSVEDDGDGMTDEMVKQVIDPFTTSRTERKVGLGIPPKKGQVQGRDEDHPLLVQGRRSKHISTFAH